MAGIPDRTTEQRKRALNRANEIRVYRAVLKRDIKAGRVSLAEVLTEPNEMLETAYVIDLLLALPRYGRRRVDRVLRRHAISASKTVAGLSSRQRTVLLDELRYGGGVHARREPYVSPPRPVSEEG